MNTKKCFFCDVQETDDPQIFAENELFFARFDDFPVSEGHAEIIPKRHTSSISGLSNQEILALFSLLNEVKAIIQNKFNPDGFNFGINEGSSAGQTVFHLHVHIIPRYKGDVANPCGGVRGIFPDKADYTSELKKLQQKSSLERKN